MSTRTTSSILTRQNALTRQYQKLFELDNVTLRFTSDALRAIAHRAIDARPARAACATSWKRHARHRCISFLHARVKECVINDAVIERPAAVHLRHRSAHRFVRFVVGECGEGNAEERFPFRTLQKLSTGGRNAAGVSLCNMKISIRPVSIRSRAGARYKALGR